MESYSIHEHFSGGAVFLTGATGYVGALVLEKLLRCTNIDTVYVMLRSKKDEDVQKRLQKVLNSSPVMHLLRGNLVLSKVKAVAGDMKAAGLGTGSEDLALLRQQCHTVIHCAADIRLEVGIQDLLQTNYEGTRQLLELAGTFEGLKAFVHVSSAYTNMNATPGSLVQESIYPLSYGDQPVVDSELVQELLSMPAHNANLRAEGLLAQWNFKNNYTLSKHLAEYMVADYQQHACMPVAIVRPTLISSVARDPYPGYTGNYAGHVGATLAFMVGLFDSPAASNYKASNVWDVIPSDVVANVILAAAAALGHPGCAAACHVSPTRVNPQHQQHQALQEGANGCVTPRAFESSMQPLKQQHQVEDGGAFSGAAGPLLIVHCGSSTSYPLTIMESWNWGCEVYGAWTMPPNLVWGKCAGPMLASYEPDPKKAAHHMNVTSWKVWAAAKMLGLFKMGPVARKLKIGFESFKIINQPKTDVNLRFSTHNMQRLAALLAPEERDDFLLLWRPKPTGAHARPGRFPTPRGLGSVASIAQAAPLRQQSCSKLPAGSAAQHASAPEEQQELQEGGFLIKAAVADTNTDSSAGSRSSSARSSQDLSPTASSSPPAPTTASAAQKDQQQQQPQHHGPVLSEVSREAVRRMRAIPVEWRTFHINLGAYLYCSMFKMPLPAPELPISKPEVVRWLNIKTQDQVIRHQFCLYK